MISKRTRGLLCGAALAPSALVLGRLSIQEEIDRAHAEGSATVWVEPGFLVYAMLIAGLLCFAAFVFSLLVDLRTGK